MIDAAVSGELTGAEDWANAYGRFDRQTDEFVVTNLRPPRPWINVLANERYGVVASQAGGGFSWFENCQIYRLSRWEQDLVKDEYGRFLYVQDLDRPDELWSTTFQPTRREAEFEEVRHGLGYSVYRRRFLDLEVTQTVFVPVEDPCEVWLIEIRNLREEDRRLRLGSYLEWHLGGIGDWHREFHRLFMESRADGNALIAWKHPEIREHQRTALQEPNRSLVAWAGVQGVRWITDKTAWLGRVGSQSDPEAFRVEPPSSDTPRWDDPIAGSLVDLELRASGARTVVLTIGAESTDSKAVALAARYDEARARQELERVRRHWRSRCEAVAVRTGDEAIDALANSWLPYQAIAGRLYARCAYYQQGGAYGFRDQLQDSLMFLRSEPAETLKQLGRHAEATFEDGGVRHWWHPGTDIGPESHHSDTCLWLAYGTLAYLDATSDLGALQRTYGYLNRDQDVPWVETALARRGYPEREAYRGEAGSLLDHCLRGIGRSLALRSERGLPLIGAGDWNDGLSHAGIDGRGESVWLAMFLYDILNRWQPYLRRLGKDELAERFAREAGALEAAVNEHAWDGEWYIGGTRDDGRPFGSRENEEGTIFLNPQTWAVISGIAPPDRAARAMQSVRERLVTPYGALLLRPAFSQVDPYIGYITRYAPALRENGGVYSHASTWAVWAFAKMGERETALAIYRGMLPSLRAQQDADLYAAEPYVMPGNVDGPDSPYAGRAGWTWYTGSAAWMVRVAGDHLAAG